MGTYSSVEVEDVVKNNVESHYLLPLTKKSTHTHYESLHFIKEINNLKYILQFKFFQQVKKYMWSPLPGAKYWPLTVIPASEYSDIWARASLLVTFHRA